MEQLHPNLDFEVSKGGQCIIGRRRKEKRWLETIGRKWLSQPGRLRWGGGADALVGGL